MPNEETKIFLQNNTDEIKELRKIYDVLYAKYVELNDKSEELELGIMDKHIRANTITASKYNELRNTYVFNGDDSLDANSPFELDFEIVSEMTAINNIKLSFRINKFRAYSTTATAIGGGAAGSAIDIGSPAIDRATFWGSGHTNRIVKGNPANGTGKITSIEIYAHSAMTDVEVATFYQVSANVFSTRDNEAIGNISAGYSQHNVDLDVEAGDLLGMHYTSGEMELTGTGQGQVGVWKLNDVDAIPCTDTTFTFVADCTFSLYGSGITSANPHTHDIVFGIYEEVQSPAINVYIDNGADYGDSIGEYTTDQLDIDITKYIRGTGFKRIKFTSTARTRITAWVLNKIDLSA